MKKAIYLAYVVLLATPPGFRSGQKFLILEMEMV